VEPKAAFAIWVTGLPASGKSTLVSALKAQLQNQGIDAAVLESDVLRKIFLPGQYDEQARDAFYRQIVYIGTLLVEHGVPVIFDATANRRLYREWARQQIARFVEVYVECPLEICMARDPKGIYGQGKAGKSQTVPGLQSVYEPPVRPDFVVDGRAEHLEEAARQVVDMLAQRGIIAKRS
jgi:adenylylsulfate kinase